MFQQQQPNHFVMVATTTTTTDTNKFLIWEPGTEMKIFNNREQQQQQQPKQNRFCWDPYSCVLQFPQLEVKTKTENETKLTKQITKVKKESEIEKALKFWNRFTIPAWEKRNQFTIPLCSQKKESIHDSTPFFLESIPAHSCPKPISQKLFSLKDTSQTPISPKTNFPKTVFPKSDFSNR